MFTEVIIPAMKEAREQGYDASDIVIYVSEAEAEELKANTKDHSSDGELGSIEGPSVAINDSRSGEWELTE